ncbi:hypothetical protein MPSD_07760 [Mycobacterium pseudoshottsii JCM 15466]|nr:hypothetical protein [Mycobacterium pseudoshottsii]BBA86466.1 hypothetical protein MPSD_07760 [Mycobacterium pseudoshottsii JCM 15466]
MQYRLNFLRRVDKGWRSVYEQAWDGWVNGAARPVGGDRARANRGREPQSAIGCAPP